MADILIKKTCGNCIHWKRQETADTVKINHRCEIHDMKTPSYVYCLAWEIHKRIITTGLLKKYRMER